MITILQSCTPKSFTARNCGTQEFDLLNNKILDSLDDELDDLVLLLAVRIFSEVVELDYPNLSSIVIVDYSCAHSDNLWIVNPKCGLL